MCSLTSGRAGRDPCISCLPASSCIRSSDMLPSCMCSGSSPGMRQPPVPVSQGHSGQNSQASGLWCCWARCEVSCGTPTPSCHDAQAPASTNPVSSPPNHPPPRSESEGPARLDCCFWEGMALLVMPGTWVDGKGSPLGEHRPAWSRAPACTLSIQSVIGAAEPLEYLEAQAGH